MKGKIIVAGVLVLVLAAGWFAVRGRRGAADAAMNAEASGKTDGPAANRGVRRRSSAETVAGREARTNSLSDTWSAADWVDDGKLSEEDKALVQRLQDALDADDLAGVTAAARQLKNSGSAAARLFAVNALKWFGTAALPELVAMIADADAEVAEVATEATLDTIADMPDDTPEEIQQKADLIAAAIEAITDEDEIDRALSLFAKLPDEVVLPILERLRDNLQDNPDKLDMILKFITFTTGAGWLSIRGYKIKNGQSRTNS